MNRVVVTRPFVGLLYMQVCAVNDASDEEILEVCNRENPSGTTAGWSRVIRTIKDTCEENKNALPVICNDDKNRTHFLVVC
jgi:hypothetical protein